MEGMKEVSQEEEEEKGGRKRKVGIRRDRKRECNVSLKKTWEEGMKGTEEKGTEEEGIKSR